MRREQVDARSAPGLAMEVDVDSGCDEDGQPQPGRPSLRKQTVLHTRAEVAKIAAALDHKDAEKSKETSLLSGPDKGECWLYLSVFCGTFSMCNNLRTF